MSATDLIISKLPEQYEDTMTCPATGLVIPKRLSDNLAWRAKLREEARNSASVRQMLKQACAASAPFWINAFGWTFRQKKVAGPADRLVIAGQAQVGEEIPVQGEDAHHPFITWKVQDEAIAKMVWCIDNGHDAIINKSRDMGASWLILTVFHWFWQFRPNTTFLELSRKESLVDRRGDMDSLFEKHRYLLRWQPVWLRPKEVRDNSMHLENKDIGTSIEGESTNEHAGQGARKTAILLDEFARVKNDAEIDLATADTSACRFFNSTSAGPNTAFSRIFKQRRAEVIMLPWVAHPEKGAGASLVDDQNGPYWAPTGKRWVSPWYKAEDKRRSKRDVAQNLDMEHGKSGDAFFDSDEIEAHRRLHQRDPVFTGVIRLDDDYNEEQKLSIYRKLDFTRTVMNRGGTFRPWRFWLNLIDGRPNQTHQYAFGVDIANGTGSSNSVVSVLDHTTNQVVAKFWDAYTSPEELAEMVFVAGIWFGGVGGRPYLVWEHNGPGTIFGKKVVALGYSPIYYQRADNTKAAKRTERYGWHSNTARKEQLFGVYRENLKTGEIINPCRESLDEALDYVYDSTGKLQPGTVGHEEGGGSALHGDHVVADALLGLARKELPEPGAVKVIVPRNSYAGRKRLAAASRQERDAWAR